MHYIRLHITVSMKQIVTQFKKEVKRKKRKLTTFLTKLEKYKIKELPSIRAEADAKAWSQTNCLACANCCKAMTPTFTPTDIKRIAPHFKLTVAEFKAKWLTYDSKEKDWVNVKQPCQFLNLSTNMCNIYSKRPADCAGFPHHHKKNIDDYNHVYKQNLSYCPATLRWVENMKTAVEAKYALYK